MVFGWCSGFHCGVASTPQLHWSLASSYLLPLPGDFPQKASCTRVPTAWAETASEATLLAPESGKIVPLEHREDESRRAL